MTMINVTPHSGEQRPTHIALNRLRLRPGEQVIYWSESAAAPMIDIIDCYSDMSGNWFTINGERTPVTRIWTRIPTSITPAAAADIIRDFTAIGRRDLSAQERVAICRAHGLQE